MKEIALCSELAGLMVLRRTRATIPNVPPGTMALGMMDLALLEPIDQFMGAFASKMGVTPADIGRTQPPADAMAYCTELAGYEAKFCELCAANGIQREHFPFVAALATVKCIGGGSQVGALDPKVGFSLAFWHVRLACHSVPYPAPPMQGGADGARGADPQ